jgi:DNA replication and repair protein RecF
VEEITPHVVAAYADLAPSSEPIDLVYRSSLGDAMPADGGRVEAVVRSGAEPGAAVRGERQLGRTLADLHAALLTEMRRLRQQELERGVCLVGPHRDDLELRLGDGPAKGYASHGESWSFALALKLGGFSLLRSDGVDPVLVLDDVFAELDTSRRDRLTELVADADQVLITAAVPDDVPETLAGSRHLVSESRIEAV